MCPRGRPRGQGRPRGLHLWSSPNSGQKIGLNLREDLFFGLHLILGKKWV